MDASSARSWSRPPIPSRAVLLLQVLVSHDFRLISQVWTPRFLGCMPSFIRKLLLSVVSLQYHLPCHFQLCALAYALQ